MPPILKTFGGLAVLISIDNKLLLSPFLFSVSLALF